MVTFNNAGRMGNWLMEACCCISYALKHGLEFTVPSHSDNPFHNPVYCLHLVNPNYNPSLEKVHLWENQHNYQELPFEETWRDKNIVIEGYRQSEKYWKEHRDEILSLMAFPYTLKEGVVALHVRRGDYVFLTEKHPHIPLKWYETAMSYFHDKTFKIFSDDIPWCKEAFKHRTDVEYSTNTNEVDDFIEMSCCEHNINSSSTFSLMAAWFNRNKKKVVITPDKWFCDGWMGMDTSDIIPSNFWKLSIIDGFQFDYKTYPINE